METIENKNVGQLDPTGRRLIQPKTKTKKSIVVSIVIVVLCILFFSGGYVFGKISEGKINFKVDPEYYKATKLSKLFDNRLVEQVWTILQTEYVDKDTLEEKELFYNALEGFVEGAGDPYTVLLDPELSKEFEQQIAGEFEGIGAQIGIRDEIVTVIAPLSGTPADKAGLLAGDKIYAVDGQEVMGMNLDKVVRLIRGPKGSQVTLLIVRGSGDAQDVIITRGVIELKSVKWDYRSDGIMYIELSAFNEDTLELFSDLEAEVAKVNPKGLVLDMRNNPGGLLNVALDISSYWIEKDKLLLTEKFGDGREIQYNAGNSTPFAKYETVALINQGSASGSEIVAGVLQEYEIAKIYGEKSYGKGSVQSVRKLPDGSSLKVTVAKWLTPLGRSINDEGIAPDVEVEITSEDYLEEKDPQLDEAIKQFK
ncbi:S41 family peptidase [Candidatus Falkowbacteria bacterium]|jgi:carboxyl-terminal processing protease|nr:S41 family peptidase [Candidatus Falkowbacteria bacterium]MBT5502846.1 S41 family peptidase [Candidatus Falkowbacteria bacterium]MBT6574624.1 S41 family peptidase [Candidatus Falkowbacteria bacterium]MBT7348873.1 S41 family peptidase [Candidatus Falkowbacteria bacterium]MBT7501024.1 S41 family peptidase [Candidatus Falkowbacteria bacterium]